MRDVGIPDVLVNNAGAGRWLPIVDTSAADAAEMMADPFFAAFNLTREFLPAIPASSCRPCSIEASGISST
jgi:NAD(P)-dependent dehydrogenase (short-subunit alcohol dehydrogenase family)